MPPKGARRVPKPNAARERGRTKPKQALVLTPRWPHLTKGTQDRTPLEPQSGYAFLSLKISNLKSFTAEKGWQLQSSRASLYSPEQAANEAAELVKRDQQDIERHQELQRQEKERLLLKDRSVGFLTLKYSEAALDRSQTPLAQSWKASRVIKTVADLDHNTQTQDIASSEHLDISPQPSSFPLNELENEPQRLTRSGFAAPTIATDSFIFASGLTPETPDFSPLTPTNPAADQYPLFSITANPTEIRRGSTYSDLEYPYPNDSYYMAGNSVDTGGVDESIKDVIQNLFVMQQHVASFRPEIQDGLNRKVEDLAVSLKRLDDLVANPSNPIHDIKIAPDIIDYVDDGRNPDIYTRDFVELVQRGNAVLNGKQRAFRNFGKIFAKSLKENFDGLDEEVDMIMENAGMVEKDGKYVEMQQNGSTARV